MRILIADDHAVTRRDLEESLIRAGYEVVTATNGLDAWNRMRGSDAPRIAILDWMMPGLDGVELCRRIRQRESPVAPYLILLTARDCKEDLLTGLEAGADDYIPKPFDREELQARVAVGHRIVELQSSLAVRVLELQDALAHIRTLQGILPICSFCKKVRDDQGYWQQVEEYIRSYSNAICSHGICPDCLEEHYQPPEGEPPQTSINW